MTTITPINNNKFLISCTIVLVNKSLNALVSEVTLVTKVPTGISFIWAIDILSICSNTIIRKS